MIMLELMGSFIQNLRDLFSKHTLQNAVTLVTQLEKLGEPSRFDKEKNEKKTANNIAVYWGGGFHAWDRMSTAYDGNQLLGAAGGRD